MACYLQQDHPEEVCEHCGGEGIVLHDTDGSEYYFYCSCVSGQALELENAEDHLADLAREYQEELGCDHE